MSNSLLKKGMPFGASTPGFFSSMLARPRPVYASLNSFLVSTRAGCARLDLFLRIVRVFVMHAINRIKKKRRKPTKMCHFKDTQSFKPTPTSTVRSHIMMKNLRWGKFPNYHVLSKVSDVNEKGLYILHESILQEDVGVDDDKFRKEFEESLAFDELVSMCNDIVRRHNKVMLRTAYCAKKLNDPNCRKLMMLYDVYLLVRRAVLSVFPSKLLGPKTNWQKFLLKIKSLMYQGYSGVLHVDTLHKLPNRKAVKYRTSTYSDFTYIKQPVIVQMNGIKQSDIPWLRTLRYNGQRQRIIAKILRWIVNWALTYISSFWHVAYSSKGLIFYDRRYSKAIQMWYWQHLEDQTYNNMIKEGKLTIAASTTQYSINAVLQFIPKGEGFRPLIKSKNDFLSKWNVRAFLKCVIRKYAWKCNHRGNLQDVISVLQKLASMRKLGIISKLYYVKVDIDDAFGSISHKKLQPILKRIFESLLPKDGKVREHKFQKFLRAGYFKEFFDYQFRDEKCVPPKGFLQIYETERNVREVITLLETCSNIAVHFRGKDHVMTQGVGQGVKISSFLSEVYYRDMVETHFSSFLTNPHEHLLRYADDILLITPDRDRAILLLNMTKAGFPDYNCRMNPNKTCTNVDSAASSSLVRYLGGLIDFDKLTLTPFFKTHVKGTVKSVRFDKKTQVYKVMRAKDVLLTCNNICGARNDPWFLDLRVNGKDLVLKTLEESACFLTRRLINTEALLGGAPSPKFIMWRILGFCGKLAKSCRRIFSARFPTSGKAVSKKEIELALFRGVFRVVSNNQKWERVRLALRHKLRKLRAIADYHPNA